MHQGMRMMLLAHYRVQRALKNMKGMVIKHQRREVICHIVGQYMSLNVMPACSPILAWSLIVGSKVRRSTKTMLTMLVSRFGKHHIIKVMVVC